ncbi:TonB-dependent receptor [Saprospiraceae bacterium]|nr:TonB-dependent receptor [Saprospiraceae bacterium]
MGHKIKFLLILLLLCCIRSASAQIDYKQEVSLIDQQITFEQLIAAISNSTEIQFSYSSAVIDPMTIIVLAKKNYILRDLLDEIASKLYIQYIEFNKKILFVELPEKWEEFWLYGYVRDKTSGEAIIGAIIYNQTSKIGTETNAFGFFSLKVVEPNSIVKIASLSYVTETLYSIERTRDKVNINLTPRYTIPTIIVTPTDSIESKYMIDKIFDNITENINPGLLGEKDVLQKIKGLPGIQSGSENQGNILVRGGGSDQNLMLMDGVPMYETNHLIGLTSIFNENVVNSVDVATSGFSAKYGGRLSSVIDVHVKNGNKFRHKGSASLGLLGASIHAEGPINEGKTSYNIGARTSFINELVKPVAERFLDIDDTEFNYSDLNFKFHHQLTENNSISINTYAGRDVIEINTSIANPEYPEILSLQSKNRVSWTNSLVNIRFEQLVNKKLFFNVSASTTNYNLRIRSSDIYRNFNEEGDLETAEREVFASSQIRDNTLRTDWEYHENKDHALAFGIGMSQHTYNPSIITEDFISSTGSPNLDLGILGVESFIYAEDTYDVSEYLTFVTGFHLSQFDVEDELFTSFQPRMHMNIHFNPQNNLSLSYSEMTQFVHLLVNPGTGLPADLWLPATSRIPPEESTQYSAKYTRIWNKEIISYASAYYKTFENLVEYRSAFPLYNPVINGSTLVPIFGDSQDWEDRVEVGTGQAYGLELFTAYQTEKLKTSLSYTLAFSTRLFENVNDGERFPFKFDRRHDINLSATYDFSSNWSFGMNWVYGSGQATTFSTTEFLTPTNEIIVDNGDRNKFRLPDYHRLDLSAIYSKKINKNYTFETSFGIYNVYNRLNPYYVYLLYNESADEYVARQVGIFPILPSINVSVKY